ncbi:PAS domain-containing protein, partial [Tribonema minus]
ITSPYAAAAAAAALKALPPSSTALTKKRTHNKEEQQQKRRERNRVLAKRTRLRKKFMFQSLQTQVSSLHMENERLKEIVIKRCGDRGPRILADCCRGGLSPVVASCTRQATALLQRSDFLLMKALQTSQPAFCVTDPTLADCPIVYASDGFIALTGYSRAQVLGRNCRFLQGPDTDPDAVGKLRRGIEAGRDTSVFLRNYNASGESFWNFVFVSPLRNAEGKVINYVGIQHPVDNPPAPDVLEIMMGDSDDIYDDADEDDAASM